MSGMSATRSVIVFDLDGTLVDSLTDIVKSFVKAFEILELEAPSEAAARSLVGPPLEEMYRQVAPPERVGDLVSVYREYYPQHYTDNSAPYPGVPEALVELRRRGYRLAVATTKRQTMAAGLIAAVGLAGHLDHVQGTDGFPAKPAPDVVHRAVAGAGGEGLWMVGDTRSDILAGRAAGLKTYAVGWGTHTLEQLAEASPDEAAPDLERLLQLLPTR